MGGPRAVRRRRRAARRRHRRPAPGRRRHAVPACRPAPAARSPGSTSRCRWSGTSEHPTGELLSNANSDVEAAWGPIAPLPMAVGTVAMMVIAVVPDVRSPTWCWPWSALLVFPAVIAVNVVYQRLAQGWATRAQELRAEVSEIAHESFDGAMVVKTLGREPEETARFAAKAQELRDVNIRVGQYPRRLRPHPGGAAQPRRAGRPRRGRQPRAERRPPAPATSSRSPTCSPSCPSRSAPSAGCSATSPAASSATAASTPCCAPPARCPTASAARCRAGSRRRPPRRRRRWPTPTPPTSRCCATSPSPSSPGRTVALVGATASGKSTLTTLLTRLVDPDAGTVAVDGTDLRDLERGALAERRRARAADGVPLRRHRPRQRHPRRRRRRRRRLGGAAHRPGRRLRRRAARRALHPARRARHRRSPAGSASASPWPAPWCAARAC